MSALTTILDLSSEDEDESMSLDDMAQQEQVAAGVVEGFKAWCELSAGSKGWRDYHRQHSRHREDSAAVVPADRRQS